MRDKNIDHPLRVRRLKCWRLRRVRPTAHSPNGQCVIAANGDTAKKGLKRLATGHFCGGSEVHMDDDEKTYSGLIEED